MQCSAVTRQTEAEINVRQFACFCLLRHTRCVGSSQLCG